MCCETSSLLPQLGSSSRALGGSRSQKQIGRCHGQIQMPLKPLFILVLQKVKKNKLALFAKSTRAPQVVLTTSYPLELGILRTSVSKCIEKRIVPFLPSFPEDLQLSLPLCFLFHFSLGCLSTAILIQLCRSGTAQSNSFSHPERPGTRDQFSTPRPCSGHLGTGVLPVHNSHSKEKMRIQNLIFIPNPVLGELSGLHSSMAMWCTVTLPLGPSN